MRKLRILLINYLKKLCVYLGFCKKPNPLLDELRPTIMSEALEALDEELEKEKQFDRAFSAILKKVRSGGVLNDEEKLLIRLYKSTNSYRSRAM